MREPRFKVIVSKATGKKLAKWHDYDAMPHMGARLVVISANGCYDGSATYAHYSDVIDWAERVRKMRMKRRSAWAAGKKPVL